MRVRLGVACCISVVGYTIELCEIQLARASQIVVKLSDRPLLDVSDLIVGAQQTGDRDECAGALGTGIVFA